MLAPIELSTLELFGLTKKNKKTSAYRKTDRKITRCNAKSMSE